MFNKKYASLRVRDLLLLFHKLEGKKTDSNDPVWNEGTSADFTAGPGPSCETPLRSRKALVMKAPVASDWISTCARWSTMPWLHPLLYQLARLGRSCPLGTPASTQSYRHDRHRLPLRTMTTYSPCTILTPATAFLETDEQIPAPIGCLGCPFCHL